MAEAPVIEISQLRKFYLGYSLRAGDEESKSVRHTRAAVGASTHVPSGRTPWLSGKPLMIKLKSSFVT